MEEEDGSSSWVLRAKFSHTFVRSKSLRPLESTLSNPSLLPLSSSSSSSTEQAPPVGTTNKRSTSRVQNTPSKIESLPPRAGERTAEAKNPGGSSEFSLHSDDRRSSLLSSEFCTGTLKHGAGSSPATTSAPSRDERNSKPKQRSVSPLPATILSDAFKEARLIGKRFSTPPPSRRRFEATSQRRNSEGSRVKQSPKAGDRSRSRIGGGNKVASVDATDEWNAKLSELYIGLRFASGAHSKLYHGIYKDKKVAVKAIRQPDDDEVLAARLEEEFTREVMLLSHLNHPNVIKLAGACKDPPVFFIITEYLSGGSLRAFLHKLDHGTLPLLKVIGIALEIARGMEYIHSQGIVHRDLKPENILFDEEFHIKVVDFGIACEERYCYALAEDAGTYRWMAPEIIKHKHYGRKVDVYSFGLILWEMLTGVIPYADMTPEQAAFAVIDKNLRPVIPPYCPPPLHVLIEQCWTSHPDKRPEFWQIVKVLEQFECAISRDGNLNQCQNLTSQDHKNKLLHWLDKLKPFHPDGSGTTLPKLL